MNKQFDYRLSASSRPEQAGNSVLGEKAERAADERFVELQLHDDSGPIDRRSALAWKGFTAEHVVMHGARNLSFDWAGDAHYVALHDIRLIDGEIALAETSGPRRLDLRDRLTVAPSGCRVAGWSSFAERTNEYTALTFDADVLQEEVECNGWRSAPEPSLYFLDASLRATLTKLRDLLLYGDATRNIYAETLGLMAVIEVNRHQTPKSNPSMPASGALSNRQERLVREYIQENLEEPLSLAAVAAVAGLTRFHFARAFRRSFGTTPHAFISEARINRAKMLLGQTQQPIASIANLVGFNTQNHFAAAFRAAVGCTPSQFRRAMIDP